MERTEVFETMNIDVKKIHKWREEILLKAALIRSNLKDWSRFHDGGRIIVGWKRIAYGYPAYYDIHCQKIVNFIPISTIEIIRRKVRAWLNKR